MRGRMTENHYAVKGVCLDSGQVRYAMAIT
jgi:hypothetical protein